MPTMGGLRFRLLTGRLEPESEDARRRARGAAAALAVLERHLATREYLAGGHPVADIGVSDYVHVAHEAGTT